MFKLIIAILFINFSMNVMAQTAVKKDIGCNFLKNLKFKNGTDTITVKATYDELFRSPDYSLLKQLDKEKKLHYSDFGTEYNEIESSTSISFFTGNCSKKYMGTISKNQPIDVNTLKPGTIIYLTCVIFEGAKWSYSDGTHFFVIINVALKKP
jgi:hypothetical protein